MFTLNSSTYSWLCILYVYYVLVWYEKKQKPLIAVEIQNSAKIRFGWLFLIQKGTLDPIVKKTFNKKVIYNKRGWRDTFFKTIINYYNVWYFNYYSIEFFFDVYSDTIHVGCIFRTHNTSQHIVYLLIIIMRNCVCNGILP